MALASPEPSAAGHRSLVVLLHAFRHTPARLADVAQAVREQKADAHVVAPLLPLRMWSRADLAEVAHDVVGLVDEQVNHREERGWAPFEEIVFVGHSTGSMISRKAYVIASGETPGARFTHGDPARACFPARPWVGSVTRIVQLAGMNGGWSVSHHMGLRRSLEFTLGALAANLVLTTTGRPLAIDQIRRGAPFLTGLRLEWLEMTRAARRDGREVATVVQLLGTVDDLVAPDDNVDLVTGSEFLYVDVPQSGHTNVVRFDAGAAGAMRRDRFVLALTGSADDIARESVLPADDAGPGASRAGVTDVVFVIHGIRDTGYWTHKIARRVQAVGSRLTPPRVFATETSTYGYFPMLSFLLPSRRREKVAWLADQYVRARAAYPGARYSYVGHSNGTYLLARALEDHPAIRFDHVVFAGSVVRRGYDWAGAVGRGQVKAVLNYVATNDLVVACFPGALEQVSWLDLGAAGHAGFTQASAPANTGFIVEKRFVQGTHAAALAERHWDDIARFVCTGLPPAPLEEHAQRGLIVWLGKAPALVWLLIAALLVLVAWAIWSIPAEWLRVLLLVLFAWVVGKVLTRF